MTYTGLELFMEKLKQIIYCNGHPVINKYFSQKQSKKHTLISSQMFQIQLVYEELGSMIQTLFVDKENYLNNIEEVRKLKKRFKDVAEEAGNLVDRFVSDIILRSKILEVSLNLEDVMRSLKSIKVDVGRIFDNMKLNSSPGTQTNVAAAGTSLVSKKIWDEIVVGIDHDVELIRDKLVEDQRKLDVISIVGMGGLGKTTLATKVFNDPFVKYHFHVCVWVTVTQTYEKRDLLIQILAFMDVELDLASASNSKLREMLHKRLTRKRYLIVIDDIWSDEAWDDLKVFFPNDHTGSRILLTSRLNDVALHATSNGFLHQLQYLADEKSWELLCKKVFHVFDCPDWLIESGMLIAKNCRGLPLAVVVIAGVLSKESVNKESWEKVSQSVSSLIVNDPNEYAETLALSINNLPSHLRDCFLYLGGFPEDFKFRVEKLIWLWIAEGFIHEDGNQSTEETAEDYLTEQVDRNLVVVQARKFNGAIKTFSVHDILRELCVDIATKERFFLMIPSKPQIFDPFMVAPYKKRRIFTNHDTSIINAPSIRSFLSFYRYPILLLFTRHFRIKFPRSWWLLMVLDLQHTKLDYITGEISLLVHLRFLAILYNGNFPSSVCNLWNLQTLIIQGSNETLKLPNAISKLVNLRHLCCPNVILMFPPIQKPLNLQTISKVALGDTPNSWVTYFPGIKKLSTVIYRDINCDFKSLIFLDTLSISFPSTTRYQMHGFSFSASLKNLTLKNCHLSWREMSKI